jgi:hypothetical protein
LDNAQTALDKAKAKVGISMIGAFKAQVLSLMRDGTLSAQDANALVGAADLLLQSLQI